MANAITFAPAMIATYWVRSNMYVIGDVFQLWFVGKLQSGFPLTASTAINDPLSSPKNTRPVAVASVPPHENAGPGCGTSHFTSPVRKSSARKMRCGFGSVAVFCEPPRYVLPWVHSASSFFV